MISDDSASRLVAILDFCTNKRSNQFNIFSIQFVIPQNLGIEPKNIFLAQKLEEL
jgi:hypothetical protein